MWGLVNARFWGVPRSPSLCELEGIRQVVNSTGYGCWGCRGRRSRRRRSRERSRLSASCCPEARTAPLYTPRPARQEIMSVNSYHLVRRPNLISSHVVIPPIRFSIPAIVSPQICFSIPAMVSELFLRGANCADMYPPPSCQTTDCKRQLITWPRQLVPLFHRKCL